MMNFEVSRFGLGLDSTLSRVSDITDGGNNALCWGLEDERRETKVFAETCIPTGTYEMVLRTFGGFHDRYARKFGSLHKGMVWLRSTDGGEVPGFTDILWHCGNDDDDTGGCLLLGSTPFILPHGEFTIGESVKAYKRVYPLIANPLSDGVRCFVTYLERQAAA